MKATISKVFFGLCFFLVVRISIRFNWFQSLVTSNFFKSNGTLENYIKFFILFSLIYFLWRRIKYCERFNQLPGLKTNFGIIGNLKEIYFALKRTSNEGIALQELLNSFSLLTSKKEKGLFTFWLGPKPCVLVTSPESIRQILCDHGDLRKGLHYELLEMVLGRGLITSRGEKWQYHRKLLTPTFNFKILESFISNMMSNVRIFLENLEQEARSNPDRLIEDISRYTFPCTYEILLQTSMGINPEKPIDEKCVNLRHFHPLLTKLTDMMLKPWLWLFKYKYIRPLTTYGRMLNKHIVPVLAFGEQLISDRLAYISKVDTMNNYFTNNKEPFMDTLLREHMKDPQRFTLTDVRDEVHTFIGAGHDTTGWTLTYVLFLLGHHPEVQEKVQEEIDSFFNSFEKESDITIDSLKELKYLEAVIKETLRLYTPIPLVTRQIDQDLHLNQFVIPAGAQIGLGLSQLHRNPEYWSEPARFKPERFIDFKAHPYTFIPFSAGPRNCVGQRFAMVQLKSLLSFILKEYTIQSLDAIDSILISGAPIALTHQSIRIKIFHRSSPLEMATSNDIFH